MPELPQITPEMVQAWARQHPEMFPVWMQPSGMQQITDRLTQPVPPNNVPTMSAYNPPGYAPLPKYDTYEEWMAKNTPAERNAFTQLPASEMARLSGDIVHDAVNTTARGTLKIPLVLGSVPALGIDALVNGSTFAHQGLARLGQLLHWDGYDDAYVRDVDEQMQNVRQYNKRTHDDTRGMLERANAKIDAAYPRIINDPQPNEMYTGIMKYFGGDKDSYSTYDLLQHAGEIGTSTSGALSAGKMLNMASPHAGRVTSPVQHTDVTNAGKYIASRVPANMQKTRAAMGAVGRHVNTVATDPRIENVANGMENARRVLHLKPNSAGARMADAPAYLTPAGIANAAISTAAEDVADDNFEEPNTDGR